MPLVTCVVPPHSPKDQENDEHGEYVHQGHHWEQPCFCPSYVAEALEPIAKRMRSLIPKVAEAEIDQESSFLEALEDAVGEIGSSLPDWMGAWEGDGMGLGPEVTACLLEAEQAWVKRRGESLAGAIERIQEFELENKRAGLDDGAAVAFLKALPREELQELVKSVGRGPAEKRLPWWQTVIDLVEGKKRAASKAHTKRTGVIKR